MNHNSPGVPAHEKPVWANLPDGSRTHRWATGKINQANPNRTELEASTGHRDLRTTNSGPTHQVDCHWCGWRFPDVPTATTYLCLSETDPRPERPDALLHPYYVQMQERHLIESILDGIPNKWIPKDLPPHTSADQGEEPLPEDEAAFFAAHSGIPAVDLTPEVTQAAREKVARGTATANVLRYAMWLIGTEIHPATARAEQATINMLFRIRDEYGLLTPASAGRLVDPDNASPETLIASAHERGLVLRYTLGDLHLYPGFQFNEREPHSVIAALRDIADTHSVSENTLVLWMIRATTRLNDTKGNRPVDLLQGRADQIPALAEQTFNTCW